MTAIGTTVYSNNATVENPAIKINKIPMMRGIFLFSSQLSGASNADDTTIAKNNSATTLRMVYTILTATSMITIRHSDPQVISSFRSMAPLYACLDFFSNRVLFRLFPSLLVIPFYYRKLWPYLGPLFNLTIVYLFL